jgi:glycerol-3-phosphate dehydrogenase (NAD(P)+)
MQRIAVIGAGAWGTALAALAGQAGRDVALWAREPEVVTAIREHGENSVFLPDVQLAGDLTVTDDVATAVANADAVLLVVPAQHMAAAAARLAPVLGPDVPLVVCAKGIETATGRLMTEVLDAALPGRPQAVLSGPTFAKDVAQGLPAAVTLAAWDGDLAQRLVDTLGSRTFRPYAGTDPIGVQIGGAVKNVAAIACGIVAGRGLGENARAALITRALAEITRLGVARGARADTFTGLSGLGDLTLTCTSRTSRNYALGEALAGGERKAEVLARRPSVAEGAYTAEAVAAMAHRLGVDMPICRAVDAVLNRDADVTATITDLLARPFKTETAA